MTHKFILEQNTGEEERDVSCDEMRVEGDSYKMVEISLISVDFLAILDQRSISRISSPDHCQVRLA